VLEDLADVAHGHHLSRQSFELNRFYLDFYYFRFELITSCGQVCSKVLRQEFLGHHAEEPLLLLVCRQELSYTS
jgi:hypothetical protein